jgi:hypothetical protein
METKLGWRKNASNLVLEGNGFYISYNPNTFNGHGNVTNIANTLGSLIGAEKHTDGEETALYGNNTWYILTGDFRKDYEEAFERGFLACLDVYEKHKAAHRNAWSTD